MIKLCDKINLIFKVQQLVILITLKQACWFLFLKLRRDCET